MKKVVAGIGVMITGAILTLSVYIVAGMTIINPLQGWNPDKGIFWDFISQLKLVPTMTIGILLIIIGAILMAWGIFAGLGYFC